MTSSTPKREVIADEVLSVGVPFDLGTPVRQRRRVSATSMAAAALFLSGAAVALGADRVVDAPSEPMALVPAGLAKAASRQPSKAAPEPMAEPAAEPVVVVAEPVPGDVSDAAPLRVTRPARAPAPVPAPTPVRVASTERRPAPRWDNGGQDSPALATSLDSLLDAALGGAPEDPVTTPIEALPATPTRRQVSTTLRALEGEIRQCGDGDSGILATRVVVEGGTGRVTSAVVTGEFTGTSTGSCAARVLRTARFPRFAQERFEVAFPYRL